MDFLGLSNMTIVGNTMGLIEQTCGITLNLKTIPYDDAATYQMLGDGETTAVFQLESAGMRRYIKELKPRDLKEIAALIALYRPGPMNAIPRYIKAKQGDVKVTYLHPDLEPILKETFGVIVYQDQAMLIAVHLAGYSWSEADALRKAMAKKKPEIIAQHRSIFTEKAVQRGVARDTAEAIFAHIEPFAGYGFPKAHAARYANDCYQNAFLKANYPAEYMASVLTAEMGDAAKVSAAVVEARRLGVDVRGPDVNLSQGNFSVEQGGIRFGLAAIKNVGAGPVEAIVKAREEAGSFASLEDIVGRVDLRALNRKALECLIKAGATDCLGDRSSVLESVESAIAAGQQMQRASLAGQSSLFDGPTVTPYATKQPRADAPVPEAALKERLRWEKDLLGMYLSEHPLARMAVGLRTQSTHSVAQLAEEASGLKITLGGMLTSIRRITTKTQQTMLAVELEDMTGTVEAVVFPRTFESTRELWEEDAILLISGRLDVRGDRTQVVVESASTYQPNQAPKRHHLRITVPRFGDTETCRRRLERLRDLLVRYPGSDGFELRVANHIGIIKIADVPNAYTGYCPELDESIRKLLGADALAVQELRPKELLAAV
jgi:DNA polymerase-3 subunit alpha